MMQTIVITGCSSGIGLRTALYLQEKGLRVYPTARKEEDVERLKALGLLLAQKLDVRKAEEIAGVIDTVLQREGKIDVWFNNAGYGQPSAIEDLPTEVLKEQFETNVFGLHEATRQIIPVMRRQGYGKIIQHSSVLGLISLFGRGAYNASKYAIEGLTDTLRLELMGTQIYPVLLNTGPITSDFRKNAMAKLQENISIEQSYFKQKYIENLQAKKSSVPFNLEAIAVAEVVYEIVSTPQPKPRYYITKATYLLGTLKRILSTRWLDKLLVKL